MQDISGGKESLSVSYHADIEDTDDKEQAFASYMRLFTSHIDREAAFGSSLFGIHRDDLDIKINGKSAREFASQGQQRSVVLALKMAEGEISGHLCGEYPIYLLDDVLSELDDERRKYLLYGIEKRQFIVTGCEKRIIADQREAHFIRVDHGTFQEEN